MGTVFAAPWEELVLARTALYRLAAVTRVSSGVMMEYAVKIFLGWTEFVLYCRIVAIAGWCATTGFVELAWGALLLKTALAAMTLPVVMPGVPAMLPDFVVHQLLYLWKDLAMEQVIVAMRD